MGGDRAKACRFAKPMIALVVVVCLVVTGLLASRAVLRRRMSYEDYQWMVASGELTGLTLREAARLIRYPSRTIDEDSAEFYLPHLDLAGWTWIVVEVQDGVIVESILYTD